MGKRSPLLLKLQLPGAPDKLQNVTDYYAAVAMVWVYRSTWLDLLWLMMSSLVPKGSVGFAQRKMPHVALTHFQPYSGTAEFGLALLGQV